MKQGIIILFFFCQISNLYCQGKYFTLNELAETGLPKINDENGELLSETIYSLFNEGLSNPSIYSTRESTEEIIYYYADTDYNGRLEEYNPQQGKRFVTYKDKTVLDENRILISNIKFSSDGKMIIPDSLTIISYKEQNRYSQLVNAISFRIPIDQNSRNLLKRVKLSSSAFADINSLTGGLTPVNVIIPIEFYHTVNEDEFANCKIKVRRGSVNFEITQFDRSKSYSYVEDEVSKFFEGYDNISKYHKKEVIINKISSYHGVKIHKHYQNAVGNKRGVERINYMLDEI